MEFMLEKSYRKALRMQKEDIKCKYFIKDQPVLHDKNNIHPKAGVYTQSITLYMHVYTVCVYVLDE
jgi:hypothetical protein